MLFSALIVLLIIGYLLFPKNDSQRPDGRKNGSTAVTQEKQDIEKSSNVPLRITKAKLQLESVDNVDRVRVIVEENRNDKDNISYKYEWFKNDVPIGDNGDNVTGFRKDDKIDVRITPFAGTMSGQPVFLTMIIARVPPKVVENKIVKLDGNNLSYQVSAMGPEDETLSYSLVDGPKDMTIDNRTGMITWNVNSSEHGKQNVNVMIKSSNGTQAVYPLSIDFGKANE